MKNLIKNPLNKNLLELEKNKNPQIKKNLKFKILSLILIFFTSQIFSQNLSNYYLNGFLNYKNLLEQENQNLILEKAINSFLDELPLSQAISQIFLVNIEGNEIYLPVEKSSKIKFCAEENSQKNDENAENFLVPGGVLLFSFNIGKDANQLMNFIDSIKSYCEKNNILPPFVSTDQEGGIVNRLYPITSYVPSNQKVAQTLTIQEATQLYELQAKQMSLLGFNMNLAPVCESLLPLNEKFLQSRSYGNVPKTILYSMQAVSSYEKNNVATVLKHFPGNSNSDPHSSLPKISVSKEYALWNLILPFDFILSQKPSAVLMSHATTSFLDPQTPACFSEKWIEGLLKNKLKFDGLVLSDDIFMAALSSQGFDSKTAAVKAINAGVNIIMLSEKTYAQVAENLISYSQENPAFQKKLYDSIKKVIKFKIDCGILALEKNSNGTYKINVVKNQKSISSRLEEFAKVKKMGDDFYIKNFK